MNVTKIGITVGRTQNTGNFNSLRFDATYEADIQEGDDLAASMAELAGLAKDEVMLLVWDAKESYAQDWPISPR